jgi:undecaprenyl-diphosphatase
MNASLSQWLFGFARFHPLLDAAIVFLARYFPYLLALAFLGFILNERGARRRLFLLFETALAILLSRGILTEGIRFFHAVQRPFEAWQAAPLIPETLGNSFPSGHAAFFFALATVLFFHNKKWGAWFLFFAVINGVSRIVAGVHWPIDVAGGALIGIGSAAIVHLLLRRTSRALRIETHPAPPAHTALPPETGTGAA